MKIIFFVLVSFLVMIQVSFAALTIPEMSDSDVYTAGNVIFGLLAVACFIKYVIDIFRKA